MHNNNGYFISFEGIDGSGKTTQIKKIKKYLELNLKKKVLITREPGGTEEGELIRNLILNCKQNISWDSKTEILLLFAARSEHFSKVIMPGMKAGKIILCDRYIDSTIAYQCHNNKKLINLCYDLSKLILNNYYPNLTVLLDIDPKVSLSRLQKRSTKDRYDIKDISYFNNVRNEYLKLSKKLSRIKVFDSSIDEDILTTNIINFILKKIN